MKYIFRIIHLGCANCGNKIQEALSKEPGVKTVHLNFMLKRLELDIETTMDDETLTLYIEKLANRIERGVKFELMTSGQLVAGDEQMTASPRVKASAQARSRKIGRQQLKIVEKPLKNYTFNIENLACGHCASKIEARLKQEAYLEQVQLNFMLKKLSVQLKTLKTNEQVALELTDIASQIEKGVCFKVPEESSMRKQSLPEPKRETVKEKLIKNKDMISLISSILLVGAGVLTDMNSFFFIAYVLVGYDVVIGAIRNCLNGRMLDENFLMTLATIAAFIIGEYPEAVAVMIFYKLGEYMQAKAVNYSTREIEKAMDIRPDFARVLRGEEQIVAPGLVAVGEIIEVRAGEKLPLDGMVVNGQGMLDTSMLTGEALPINVQKGSKVLSGSINKDGVIQVKVTHAFQDSTVSKILELIQNASDKKSKSENFITKFAKWYTPIVVGLAVFTAIVPSLITGNWSQWIYSSIVFLVISCPCALVVSVPLGFFAGIGAASKAQILIKGSNYLEQLNLIDAIVLDKTGTITKGQFAVTHIETEGATEEEVLSLAAALEVKSNHPIAKSIVKAYGQEITSQLTDFKEISGEGLMAYKDGVQLLAGNEKLMNRFNVNFKEINEIGSPIYVARNGHYIGTIVVADEIKEDSKAAIKAFKAKGIKKVIMLTGDKKEIAEAVAREVGVDEFYAELLPGDKVEKVEALLKTNQVAFVGDGINDAPVLARADLGIAMGGVGSDAAIEAADVVLMTDELSSIGKAIDVAKRTRRIVTQNIVFALGIKVIVLLLGLFGAANMWLAIFADVGVSLIAVMNSIRVLGKDIGHAKDMLK